MAYPVTFRFYEELNFFLHNGQKKVPFIHLIKHTTTVKDAIESLGVPHTEIDLILANSKPVKFDYRLQPNDFISVYPTFESLDISGLNPHHYKPLRNPKFILDVHLGKLARYLRLLGFDSLYNNKMADDEIIRHSFEMKRIILTRDLGILKNNLVTHGYFLKSQNPKEQLVEVIRRFQLEKQIRPFSRCTQCNSIIKKVAKKQVLNYLEPRTKQYYTRFYICTGCGSIYWEGSHFKRMNLFINKVIGATGDGKPEIKTSANNDFSDYP